MRNRETMSVGSVYPIDKLRNFKYEPFSIYYVERRPSSLLLVVCKAGISELLFCGVQAFNKRLPLLEFTSSTLQKSVCFFNQFSTSIPCRSEEHTSGTPVT